MAAKAVALSEGRQPSFARYAGSIVANARALAESLLRRGARLLTGGTDNHLVVVDVARPYGLSGRQAESALLDAGVVTNRNSIPGDPHGACYTSGIRLGTPALTTLGLGADDVDEVADIISATLGATEQAATASDVSQARSLLDSVVAAAGRRRGAEPYSAAGRTPRRQRAGPARTTRSDERPHASVKISQSQSCETTGLSGSGPVRCRHD
jgi:glycine hydroxymethyltransferase